MLTNGPADMSLKETRSIQVHDKTSLRCKLEVDEVCERCGRVLKNLGIQHSLLLSPLNE